MEKNMKIEKKIRNILQGNYPERKYMINSIEEMEKNGMSYEEMLESLLVFASTTIDWKRIESSRNSTRIIDEEMKTLCSNDDWTNLSGVVKVSIDYRNKAFDLYCQNNKLNLSNIKTLFKIQKEVVDSSVADLSKIFKSEYLKERGFDND